MLEKKKVIFDNVNEQECVKDVIRWFGQKFTTMATNIPGAIVVATDTLASIEFEKMIVKVEYTYSTHKGFFMTAHCNGDKVYDNSVLCRYVVFDCQIIYYEGNSILGLASITTKTGAAFETSSALNSGKPIIAYSPGKLPLAIFAETANRSFCNGIYGKVTDSWTNALAVELTNSVMIWSAQFSILNSDRIVRFQSAAQGFNSSKFTQFAVNNVGEFMILVPNNSAVAGIGIRL